MEIPVRTIMRKFLAAVCLAACLVPLLLAEPALAITGAHIVLHPPKTSSFPGMQFSMEVYDPAGNFLEDLLPGEVQVLEDGSPRSVDSLELTQPGLQVIVAINASPVMGNRVAGVTYYEQIRLALTTWAQKQPELSPDDFSIATNTGLQAQRLDQPFEWVQAIQSYQPDLQNLQPSLVSLSQALDLASEPNPNPGMKRAILYISPVPSSATQAGIVNLVQQARQMDVRVFVWAVGTASQSASSALVPLQSLASDTGGEYFFFSGSQAVPDIDAYLQPLRYLYQVNYTSTINQSGEHSLGVRVLRSDLEMESEPQSFNLQVSPPNPIFLSPPGQITIEYIPAAGKDAPTTIAPQTAIIRILVEYPDGHRRQLVLSRLYVDGALVDENTSPPFDAFMWPLDKYTTSASHLLQVEVEDSLGLSAKSIEATVELLLPPAPTSRFAALLADQRVVVGASLGVAGLMLVVVLLVAGRRTLHFLETHRKRRRLKDPVTQPVKIRQEKPSRLRNAAETSATIPRPAPAPLAPAQLVRLDATLVKTGNALPILHDETTFGSDPAQATCALDDPSIHPLHARMVRGTNDVYILSDCGSVAGTWVNYAPVPSQGVNLQHGDRVNIGKLAFRFELAHHAPTRRPVVSPYDEEDSP